MCHVTRSVFSVALPNYKDYSGLWSVDQDPVQHLRMWIRTDPDPV